MTDPYTTVRRVVLVVIVLAITAAGYATTRIVELSLIHISEPTRPY